MNLRGICISVCCLAAALGPLATPVAARIARSLPAVPKRIITADYLGYSTPPYPWATYAQAVTWAETPQSTVNAIDGAGISTILYTNPNRQAPHQPFYSDDETTFAHDCAGNRITFVNDPHIELMDPSSSTLWDLWVSYVLKIQQYAHYNAVLEDTADDIWGLSAVPCNYTVDGWTASSLAEDQFLQSSGVNVIYNGLGIYGSGWTVSPSIALNAATIGGMLEQCFVRPGTTNYHVAAGLWKTIENTELQIAGTGKLYFCYADNWSFPSSQAIALRQYIYASFLLTYDPSTSVLWETFPTPSGFHVNPETRFVALQPVVPHLNSIDDLHVATNVYVRTYDMCFIQGRLVGQCAAVVNPGFVPEQWPSSLASFTHTLQIGGSDVFDGGWLIGKGPAPPQTMAPISGVIALP